MKDHVIIDGVKYVPESLVSTEWNIVICDRGFVYVGKVERLDSGGIVIHQAKNIRKWGTTKGLGELRDGPRPQTELDDYGIVEVPEHAVISLIRVNEKAWA